MYQDDLEQFGLTPSEGLWERCSDKRFDFLLCTSDLVDCEVETNTWGEFVFVTLRRNRMTLCFWGWGYHEHRDRYILDWRMYKCNDQRQVPRANLRETKMLIQQRREVIRERAIQHQQSERGFIFDALADIGDDDGTLALLDDFGI